MIQREDMLELSRRMTPARSHIMRLAGAYIDSEGYIDGTFNSNFPKLSAPERSHTLKIPHQMLTSETNSELCEYRIPGIKRGNIWHFMYALREMDLKNDALMLDLYEYLAKRIPVGREYAIYLYHGVYDIPIHGSDKADQFDSEEIYSYLMLTVSPLSGPQTAGKPEFGFLWPAFRNRTAEPAYANVFHGSDLRYRQVMEFFGLKET